MPLNKLDQFIKNTEGRILYVNPSDLDSTDSITNEGNSLAQPFKTVQRALLEAARFSYLRGNNNDLTEKTTILLFPGEHIIDNRPGYAIYADDNNVAKVTPVDGGLGTPASTTLSLELDSNFDLTQEDNLLYKFNSVYGGVIVPRGTSIVGLDLRKTKIRPKYVPNPTDSFVPNSAIFRITGACYFWQFSLFDGDDTSVVYTDPRDFSEVNRSRPRFSHHKLTCFEYCDGVNIVNQDSFGNLTDLDMYYSKVSNAYNNYREIENSQKFPNSTTSFAKRAPEWEIVGSFQSDPISISKIISGNGTAATGRITVTTSTPHNFNSGTPIKIRDVGRTNLDIIDASTDSYNVSTFVQDVISETTFTYILPSYPDNLNVSPRVDDATVVIEVDTVGGASPYVFNISLRSVWGMNGMHADGAKASGFRSMVVAQFTAVSLQKDDRAFVKYDEKTRTYNSIDISTTLRGAELSTKSSSINSLQVYHLDQDAIYRPEWESSHIKISNDSFIQIVSVFAIGFTYHFDGNSGADASITNSNSNFGQIALKSDGFKVEAFEKDDHAYVTGIITPQHVDETIIDNIEWLSLDAVGISTLSEQDSNKLYLSGFNSRTGVPISLTQGYRIGAKHNDILYLPFSDEDPDTPSVFEAPIYMTGENNQIDTNEKKYLVNFIDQSEDTQEFTIGDHNLLPGEKIIIQSKKGDLPENFTEHIVYYAITDKIDNNLNSQQIKIAASYTYALLNEPIRSFGGTKDDLIITSRVSDKDAGDPGSPIQYDVSKGQWYINVKRDNGIWKAIANTIGVTESGITNNGTITFSPSTDLVYIKRVSDERGLDDKVYKLRVVIPKENKNTKNPEIGFIIQESSATRALEEDSNTNEERDNSNIIPNAKSSLELGEVEYARNQKYIANCKRSSDVITVTTELPHKLSVGDIVIIRNVKDLSLTPTGQFNKGYNGSFEVSEIVDNLTFKHSSTDIAGINHGPIGAFQNDTSIRTNSELPVLERNDIKSNLYIYRSDVISEFIENEKDGVYHLYVLNANNAPETTFTDYKFTQLPVDLYPQLDRDNVDSNPLSAKTYAKRSPVGDVVTNDLKKSITRETVDIFLKDFKKGLEIQSVSGSSTAPIITFKQNHELGGVVDGTLLDEATSGQRNEGTYYNVKLYNDNGRSVWKGATAKVVVSSEGKITSYEIMSKGSGYSVDNVLWFDIGDNGDGIGGPVNAKITLTDVTSYINSVVQITGDGLNEDGYYRITSVNQPNQITVAKGGSDSSSINAGQYAFIIEPAVQIDSATYKTETEIIDGETSITTKILTFTTSQSHGLNFGNKFRVTNFSSNNVIGDFTVLSTPNTTTIRCFTSTDYSANVSATFDNGYILKHGITSNDGDSDFRSEGYESRATPFYDGELFKLSSQLGINPSTAGTVYLTSITGNSIYKRLKLGDYLQVEGEIMRIKNAPADGATSVQVFRGYMGTRQSVHPAGSIVKKISVIPIEFRRPTIIRASGHTFEYLGYGPGNYSTALPQVQIKTLSEREDFLVQAQERSAGAVIYTGMNSKGDTFAGNTKTSSSSGETISYDIPKPTITGQDPSKLSVSFDEVTVIERILVEGGTTGQVLSQFDGPVTFTKTLRVKKKTTLDGQLRVTFASKSVDGNNGSIVARGGIGVGDDSFFKQKIKVSGDVTTASGIIPDEDFGAYIGRPGIAYSDAYIGDVQIGAGTSGTIRTRSKGLTINATNGNLVQYASAGIAQTAGTFITQTAGTSITQTATTGKVTIVASANDVEVNAGTGKSISLQKSTYITGDLEVRGPESVPPGVNSGTIRANYLEIPNITPVGGIVIWSGNENQLPQLTVNGSVVTMWAVCDGGAISRTTYSQLFGIIGTKFGTGDGTNTFNLPDLTNRFIIGSNSDSGSNIETAVKRSGGDKDAVLVAHNHDLSSDTELAEGAHVHGVQISQSGQLQMQGSTGTDTGAHNHQVQTSENPAPHVHQVTVVKVEAHRHDYSYISDQQGDKEFGETEKDGAIRTKKTEPEGEHSHQLQWAEENTLASHKHSVAITDGGKHQHSVSTTGGDHGHAESVVTGAGTHSHAVSTVGIQEAGVQNTEETGTNKNLPPYYALYYIMRIL